MSSTRLILAIAVASAAVGCQAPAPVAPSGAPAAQPVAVSNAPAVAPQPTLTALNVHAADGAQPIAGARVAIVNLVTGQALPQVATPTLQSIGVVGAPDAVLATDAAGNCRLTLANVPAGTLLKLVVSWGDRRVSDTFQFGVDGSTRPGVAAYAVRAQAAAPAQRQENLSRARQAVAGLEAATKLLDALIAAQDAIAADPARPEAERQATQGAKAQLLVQRGANERQLADARAALNVATEALAGVPAPAAVGPAAVVGQPVDRLVDLLSTLHSDVVESALKPLPSLTGSAGTQLVNETMAALATVMNSLRDAVTAQPGLWKNGESETGTRLAVIARAAHLDASLAAALSACAESQRAVVTNPANVAPGADAPAGTSGVIRVPVLNVTVTANRAGSADIRNTTTGQPAFISEPVSVGGAGGVGGGANSNGEFGSVGTLAPAIDGGYASPGAPVQSGTEE